MRLKYSNLSSATIENFFKNKFSIFLVTLIISSIWVFTISFNNFAKGIDFTDSTLTYNFSLKVLKGEVPFRDFHLFVMPFAIYVEAFFHKLFGENIMINSYLGLFNKFLQTYLIYLILNVFTKNFKKSLVFSMFIMAIMGDLNAVYFSFTPLAKTLSFSCIYLALLSTKQIKYVFFLGITIGLTFITKQNFGIIIFLAYIIYQIYLIALSKINLKNSFKEIFFCSIGISLILIPFFIYFHSVNATEEIFYILKTGSERKSVAGFLSLEFYNTFIPFLNPKVFLSSLIIGFWGAFIVFKKNLKFISLTFVLISLLGFLSLYFGGQFKNLLEVFLYDAPKLTLPFFLIYFYFFKKDSNKEILIFILLTFSLVYVNELSWPGRGSISLKTLTTLFIFVLPNCLTNYEIEKNQIINNLTKFSIISFNLIFGLLSIFFPKDYFRRDFNASTSINLPPLLINRKTSPQHKEAILKARSIYQKDCLGEKSFIFPWAPILYKFIGSENVTRYDLPYHDWLTEKEANEIIQILNLKPPCLLIIDESSLTKSGRKSPFKAYPMRKIESFLKSGFLNNYEKVETLETYTENKLVYRKIK